MVSNPEAVRMPEWLDPHMEVLQGFGPLKTWSMIVTILGDLAARPGVRLPGPVLTRLTGLMGVRPEAQRVALHRLRRDGWILSERDGRNSLYGLTEHGMSLTLEVSERVYGPVTVGTGGDAAGWNIVLAQPGQGFDLADLGDGLAINRLAALIPEDSEDVPEGAVVWPVTPGARPEWLDHQVVPPEDRAAWAELETALAGLLSALRARSGIEPEPLEAGVIRLMALHNWRRMLLRRPATGEALLGAEWPGHGCRDLMAQVLARLPRPNPVALNAEL